MDVVVVGGAVVTGIVGILLMLNVGEKAGLAVTTSSVFMLLLATAMRMHEIRRRDLNGQLYFDFMNKRVK